MREYRVIDAWRPRGKNAANGSILSGGTVLLISCSMYCCKAVNEQTHVAPMFAYTTLVLQRLTVATCIKVIDVSRFEINYHSLPNPDIL